MACRERMRQRRADGAQKEIRPSNAAEQEEQPSTLEVHQLGDPLEKRFVFDHLLLQLLQDELWSAHGSAQDDNSSL